MLNMFKVDNNYTKTTSIDVVMATSPVKFAFFLKSSLLFNNFYCLFLLKKKTLPFNNLKSRSCTNAKISVLLFMLKRLYNCYYIICMK